MPTIWRENLVLLKELLFKLGTGVRAVITDKQGKPLRHTKVRIESSTYGVSANMAYFKKILLPGSYSMEFSCPGYESKRIGVQITKSSITNVKVSLESVSSSGSMGEVLTDKNNNSINGLNRLMDDLNGKYPSISRIHEIGKDSRTGAKIMALEIGIQNDNIELTGRPSIVISAGVGPGAPATSDILATFATHVLSNYKKDQAITDCIEKFIIYVAPNLHPHAGNQTCSTELPPNERLKFPIDAELGPDSRMIVDWFKKINPIIAINLNTGSKHVEIPYGVKHADAEKYATRDESILRSLGKTYAKLAALGKTNLSKNPCKTDVRIDDDDDDDDDGVSHGGDVIAGGRPDSLMDYLYLNSSTLMINAYVTCCNTDNVLQPWKENVKALLGILKSIEQGVTGYIVTEDDQPITNAILTYDQSSHSVFNNKNGAYWILLPPGSHSVTVNAAGYISDTKLIVIPDVNKFSHLMFKLVRDDSVLGMPRLVFVIVSGKSILLGAKSRD